MAEQQELFQDHDFELEEQEETTEDDSGIVAVFQQFHFHGSVTLVVTSEGAWSAESRLLAEALNSAYGHPAEAIGQEAIFFLTDYGSIAGFEPV